MIPRQRMAPQRDGKSLLARGHTSPPPPDFPARACLVMSFRVTTCNNVVIVSTRGCVPMRAMRLAGIQPRVRTVRRDEENKRAGALSNTRQRIQPSPLKNRVTTPCILAA